MTKDEDKSPFNKRGKKEESTHKEYLLLLDTIHSFSLVTTIITALSIFLDNFDVIIRMMMERERPTTW